MTNGKQKGSAFERDVCKSLSLWVSKGKQTDLFWRSAMSGGRATVGRKKGELLRVAGDICAVTPEGHVLTDKYYIECKFYRDLDIDAFFTKSRGKLTQFWIECAEGARNYNKAPMLIAKQNLIPTLVLMNNHPNPIAFMNYWACDFGLFEALINTPFKTPRKIL